MVESHSLKRPRFFSGKLLTIADLALEQQYFREKLKRHNRNLHGFGIVSGLKVGVDSGLIVVESGVALDCEGNEVVIETTQMLSPLATNAGRHTAYVNIRFAEESCDLLPVAEVEEALTLTESFELVFDYENLNRGHRHVRARWLACGNPHALTIAKLKVSSQGWRLDRSYRAPVIK